MSIAEVESLYQSAISAMDAADWATAIVKLMALKARLIATPSLQKNVGGATSSMSFPGVGELSGLIADCRRMQAQASSSGGPFQQTKIIYSRPSLC